MPTFLPVLLDLSGRRALVIGGGEIGEGKIKTLLESGATVHVISPEVTEQVEAWHAANRFTWERREYRPGDLSGYAIVIAATDEWSVNNAIWREGTANRQLVNVVDDPPHCNFIAPSIVRRGDLIVAISTAGRSPASAKLVRRNFERRFGAAWATLLDWLSALPEAPTAATLDRLLASPIISRLEARDVATARADFDAVCAAAARV